MGREAVSAFRRFLSHIIREGRKERNLFVSSMVV